MSFVVYDVILLAIFVIFISRFLYLKRKNLKKEGLLFLYKTSLGIKIINSIGNKYRKLLNILSYVSIVLGYCLMAGVLYLTYTILKVYIFRPDIVSQIKVPPIMPLLPYLPQAFKLDFLPPFYFIYWIIIIAIIAVTHEFSHGIFAVNKKVKIKSTGFGFFPFFLPVFLAAFVELDEKKMAKKKILPQMAILSAGTFANILTAILFFGILVIFFSLAFTPSGAIFDTYTYSIVSIATITSVNNILIEGATYEETLRLMDNTKINEIESNNTKYLATKSFLEKQKNSQEYLILYDNAPAIRANLSSTVIKINGVKVDSKEEIGKELLKYSPGEKITITSLDGDAFKDYELILGENPRDRTKPYLGIGFQNRDGSGISKQIMNIISSFKDPNVHYKSNFDAAEFIYNLLWWLVLISFSVAFMNMLPVGIFDGGRFFYLTILGLTKNEKIAKKTFSIVTYLFLALLLVIMIFWAISLFK